MRRIQTALTVRRIEDLDELHRLEQDWDRLAEDSSPGNIFLTWYWQVTWARHYLTAGQLHLLMVFDGQKLVGLAPFYIRESSYLPILRCRELRFLGTEEVCSSYIDVLVAPDRHAEVVVRIYRYLFEEAADRWDVLMLTDVPCESPSVDVWHRLFAEDGKVLELVGFSVCPMVDITHGWAAIHRRIGPTARYNLSRKMKYAKAFGRVVFERLTDSDAIIRHWDEYVGLHEMRWQNQGGAFSSSRFEAFHREISRELAKRGCVTLDFLMLNEERIAAIYGFNYRGTHSYYLPAMNPERAPRVSPGFLLLAHCIEQAAAAGAATFDLLQGAADYKTVWADRLRRCLSLRGYNRSMHAVSWIAFDGMKKTTKVMSR